MEKSDMSVRVVQVDESQKDEPGVEKAVTTIAGQSIETYARLERVDDVDLKTTDSVVEIEILIPVEDDDADEGENAFIFNRAVVDMGPATLAKYRKAMAPFIENSRLMQQPESAPAPSGGRSTRVTEWNHRAKEWLRNAGHDVKPRGRIPSNLEAIYIKNHPEDPKPE